METDLHVCWVVAPPPLWVSSLAALFSAAGLLVDQRRLHSAADVRPVLEAELWALARDWKLRPVSALTGTVWESA